MSYPTLFMDAGRMDYDQAFDLQKKIQAQQIAGQMKPVLIFMEHDPVITMSRRSEEGEIIAPRKVLEKRGVKISQTNRGGQVTYHGPGQIVAYLLFNLNDHGRDLHEFLRRLEESVIRVLGRYDLKGYRVKERTGVWVGKEKICAMGIHVSRWWSTHGLALNVSTDLNHFGLIIPCGIRDRGVTSFENVMEDNSPNIDQVKADLKEELTKEFDLALQETTLEKVEEKLSESESSA